VLVCTAAVPILNTSVESTHHHSLARSFVQAAKLNNFVIRNVYGLTTEVLWLDFPAPKPPIRRTATILFAG
jgi:hypothetical protein